MLNRISYLLQNPAASAAHPPLLRILNTYLRAGPDATRAVWQCPGLQQALQGALGQSGASTAATVQELALESLQLLVQGSQGIAKAVRASGGC